MIPDIYYECPFCQARFVKSVFDLPGSPEYDDTVSKEEALALELAGAKKVFMHCGAPPCLFEWDHMSNQQRIEVTEHNHSVLIVKK